MSTVPTVSIDLDNIAPLTQAELAEFASQLDLNIEPMEGVTSTLPTAQVPDPSTSAQVPDPSTSAKVPDPSTSARTGNHAHRIPYTAGKPKDQQFKLKRIFKRESIKNPLERIQARLHHKLECVRVKAAQQMKDYEENYGKWENQLSLHDEEELKSAIKCRKRWDHQGLRRCPYNMIKGSPYKLCESHDEERLDNIRKKDPDAYEKELDLKEARADDIMESIIEVFEQD